MPCGQVVVQPNEFVIKENGSQRVEINVRCTEMEFMSRVSNFSVGGVLHFKYTDIVDSPKPYKYVIACFVFCFLLHSALVLFSCWNSALPCWEDRKFADQ